MTSSHQTGWLLYDLDTQRQSILVRENGDTWRSEVIAQARLALTLGGTLIITDTQIFDGAALLTIGPGGLREACGFPPHTSIHIAMRAGSAHASLAQMLAKSTFRSELPRAFEATVNDEHVEAMRTAWVDAIDRGDFSQAGYPTERGTFKEILDRALETNRPAGTQVATLVDSLLALEDRSMAFALLDAHPDPLQRARVERWWSSAYMDALGEQHSAAWLGTEASGINTDLPHSVRLVTESRAVTAWFAQALGSMSPSAFHELYKDVALRTREVNSTHAATGMWPVLRQRILRIAHRPRWSRRRLHLAVVNATAPTMPILGLTLTGGRVLAWGALAAWAVSEEVRGDIQGVAAVAVVVAASLLQVPWSDAVGLVRSGRSARYATQRGAR